MHVKTYRSESLATALAEARRELGANALVIDQRRIPGALGMEAHEITVAVERPPAADAGLPETLRRLAREVRPIDDRPARAPLRPERRDHFAHAVLEEAERSLRGGGLSGESIDLFRRAAEQALDDDATERDVARATCRGIASLVRMRPWPENPRVLFVVGPPGAGKTTTVAKLAARCRLLHGRPVVYAQADLQRVGAAEQAAILARAIDATFQPIDSPAQLRRTLRESDARATILVDTAGIASADTAQLDFVRRLQKSAPRAETVLMIPAGLHREEVRRVIERFAPLGPTCIGASKVDDALRLGDLVDGLRDCELPVAFATNGQRIPDDFEPATAGYWATLLLRRRVAERHEEKL